MSMATKIAMLIFKDWQHVVMLRVTENLSPGSAQKLRGHGDFFIIVKSRGAWRDLESPMLIHYDPGCQEVERRSNPVANLGKLG